MVKVRGRIALVIGLMVLVSVAAMAAGSWKTYTGAWFRVKVPTGFKVEPRELRMVGDKKEFDGVSCTSPDGKVEFYVYSPQWSGTPKWIALRPGEKQVAKKVDSGSQRTVTYVTLRGPGGKYERSYADTRGKLDGTRTVFGFRYANQAAYKKYLPLYLQFKKSLVQYAD